MFWAIKELPKSMKIKLTKKGNFQFWIYEYSSRQNFRLFVPAEVRLLKHRTCCLFSFKVVFGMSSSFSLNKKKFSSLRWKTHSFTLKMEQKEQRIFIKLSRLRLTILIFHIKALAWNSKHQTKNFEELKIIVSIFNLLLSWKYKWARRRSLFLTTIYWFTLSLLCVFNIKRYFMQLPHGSFSIKQFSLYEVSRAYLSVSSNKAYLF